MRMLQVIRTAWPPSFGQLTLLDYLVGQKWLYCYLICYRVHLIRCGNWTEKDEVITGIGNIIDIGGINCAV
jgi:hypothetical protein